MMIPPRRWDPGSTARVRITHRQLRRIINEELLTENSIPIPVILKVTEAFYRLSNYLDPLMDNTSWVERIDMLGFDVRDFKANITGFLTLLETYMGLSSERRALKRDALAGHMANYWSLVIRNMKDVSLNMLFGGGLRTLFLAEIGEDEPIASISEAIDFIADFVTVGEAAMLKPPLILFLMSLDELK